jgi:hypothetical protein
MDIHTTDYADYDSIIFFPLYSGHKVTSSFVDYYK